MKLAIMQPYFFPYLGYISLIKNTDRFILFDPVQFIRHGWIERNRVLKPGWETWQYIKIPLKKHAKDALIKDIIIDTQQNWKEKLLSQLVHYKKKAPYYKQVLDVIIEGLSLPNDSIVDINKSTLTAICNYLGIDRKIEIFSEMDINIDLPQAPDEWALNICKSIGDVDEYWNPIGGMEFFSREKYKNAGIDLKFHNVKLNPYIQRIGRFESGLSILDVMMFNSPDEINNMLDNYELK